MRCFLTTKTATFFNLGLSFAITPSLRPGKEATFNDCFLFASAWVLDLLLRFHLCFEAVLIFAADGFATMGYDCDNTLLKASFLELKTDWYCITMSLVRDSTLSVAEF